MPVDIRNSSVVRLQNKFDCCFPDEKEIPYQPAQYSEIGSKVNRGFERTFVRWTSTQCIQSAWGSGSIVRPLRPKCPLAGGNVVLLEVIQDL